MKRLILTIILAATLGSILLIEPVSFAIAQSTTSTTKSTKQNTIQSEVPGLEITPFLMELDVEKGGTIKSQVDLFNRSTTPLRITAEPRDFLPGEDGQPLFVPDTQINERTFSLASWVTLQKENQFTIQPGEQVTIPFTVNPPVDAEQGTHYGAILFSYIGSSSENYTSEIRQSLGTILLVRYGEARPNGTVALTPSKRFSFNNDKIDFKNMFTNVGKVHVQPKGEVYVKNMWGKIVATPFINKDAANVLPLTNRTFINTWYPSSFAFGRYTIETVMYYGKQRLEARDKKIIWLLPFYILIVIGIVFMALLWIIFHGRHWHKRRVIERHLANNQNSLK